MRSCCLATLLVGVAISTPVPQGFDWNAIQDPSLSAVPEASVPVVDAIAAQTTASFVASAAASSISSEVMADPTDTSVRMIKRDDDSGCATQPAADDTAQAFESDSYYQTTSLDAPTPSGWDLVFSNQTGSCQGMYGYMGYSVLESYDTQSCAASCDAIEGCTSFNIYFERDPSVAPTSDCTNPPSEIVIKCVYYGGPITAGSATNVGQYQYDFHVVIAGSNAYINNSVATPSGYSDPEYLGNSAINAPLDCNGDDTYMGVKIFTSGPFDVSLCAAACSSQSEYNIAHPPADGIPQTCQFFNTYVLYDNNQAVGQYCALYNETWPATFATNSGQYEGSDYYSIAYSYAFSNTTNGANEPQGCTNPTSP